METRYVPWGSSNTLVTINKRPECHLLGNESPLLDKESPVNSKEGATFAAAIALITVAACRSLPADVDTDPAARTQAAPRDEWEDKVGKNAQDMLEEGKKVFRHETFGSEAFWGGKLQLHKALLRQEKGGIGPGITPRQALQLGIKADVAAVPKLLREVLQEGAVSLDNPDTTLELLRANAILGVRGTFDEKENLVSIGITCALCHSTVDDSFVKGIGRRLDGWPNRDLDVGRIVALAPNLQPLSEMLGVDEATVKKVLHSWGPGKYDAQLNIDGKAFRPDGRSGATLLPAAFGLAGVNLHTYTGFGSVTYWNAYVANTQMFGQGTFYDTRLASSDRFPIAAKRGVGQFRESAAAASSAGDRVTDKLAALHFYQLAIPAPRPPEDSYNKDMAGKGEQLFNGKAKCATCHVPPLYTEPGHQLHSAEEIGIDDFQASRSPEGKYRTTPLRGLFVRAKGGFYHDGRFADLPAVVSHYESVLKISLSDQERRELVEFLKSL
jgi:Di-haem oxidoreductase, putative peroxidase